MKAARIEPARIDWSGPVPRAPDYGDLYHPAVGAVEQARQVFLRGNGLPERWRGRDRFTILETGFGFGMNFVAAWQAWRDDPRRCRVLHFVSIERHPPSSSDLERAHAVSPATPLSRELLRRWPPLVAGLHPIDLDGARVRLLLAFGDVARMLPSLRAEADAFFLDGFAPSHNPAMWSGPVLKSIGRHAAEGATAATWSVARDVHDGLRAAGFEVGTAAGIGGKRQITVARFAPRFVVHRSGVAASHGNGDEAVVIGGGIAGFEVANALARDGVEVRIFDSHAKPAGEASGNPAALFHSRVDEDAGGADGAHARLLRASVLCALRDYGPAIGRGAVSGAVDGVMQMDSRSGDALGQLQAGGWIDLKSRIAELLRTHARLRWRGGVRVARIARVARLARSAGSGRGRDDRGIDRSTEGPQWRLHDASGRVIAETSLLVLASAHDTARLLRSARLVLPPLQLSRGQVTWWLASPADHARLGRPHAGDGYAIALPDGRLLCGATRSPGEADTAVREADHRFNAERLQRLCGIEAPADRRLWQGRAALRVQTADRLPVAGPVWRDESDAMRRPDPLRRWPAEPGLLVCTALGSRGATLAPLLGRSIAAMASGSPWPLEQALVDAIDPRRHLRRAMSRTR